MPSRVGCYREHSHEGYVTQMVSTLPEGTVTIFFSDIEGSTALSAASDDIGRSLIRECNELVRQQVAAQQGIAVKDTGDGVMAAFTSVRRAVQCAIDVQRRLEQRNLARPDQVVRVRIGLNTGEVIREREDLFGSTVNAAARVQDTAVPDQILVSEGVRFLLGPGSGVELNDVGEFEFKGFDDPWRLFEVEWRETARPIDASSMQTPFVGRESHRTQFREMLDSVARGHGALTMLGGEPGIGKTRLTGEVIAEARARGMLTFVGHCYEMEGVPPYMPFVEVLETTARLLSPETFIELLGDDASQAAKLSPELRRLFPQIPDPPDLPPEQNRRYLMNSIRDFIARAAAAQPLLIVIEDLHWADESTLLLFRHLAQRVAEIPILMIGTYRHTELEGAESLARMLEDLTRARVGHQITLRPMDSDDVASMLRARSGGEPPATLVSLMLDRTQGNPFFVEELFTFFGEQGRLFGADGRWRSELDIEDEDVPDSVRLVVGRRLERVSDDCRTALTMAAVVGRTCTFDLLSQIVDVEDQALLVAMDDAQQARLAFSQSSGVDVTITFAHELTRQTLLADLSVPHRQHLHLRVADAIEQAAAESVGERAADIAHHLSRAGSLADVSRLVRFTRIAAERAETASGWVEASRQYGVCLELLGEGADPETRAELLAARGRCAWLAGEPREAVSDLRAAIQQFSATGRHSDAARAGLALLEIPSSSVRRIATAEEALALLGSDEPRLESLLTIARLQMRRLDHDAEERMSARLSELTATHSFDDVTAEAALLQASRAFYASRPDQIAAFADAAYRQFRDLHDDRGVAEALSWRARGLASFGDLDGALAASRELETHALSAGLDAMASTGARMQAGVYLARMEHSEFEEAVSRIAAEDFTGVLIKGAMAEQSGDATRALALLPLADAAVGVAAFEVVISGCRARVLHSFGRDDEAREALVAWSESLAEADGSVDALISTEAAIQLVDESLADLGTVEQVREAYEVLSACPLIRYTADQPGLDRLRGALALRLERTDDARRHYSEGLQWAERERCTTEMGRSLLGLARVEQSGGDSAEARRYLQRAGSIFEQVGAELYLGHVQAVQEAMSGETV